MALVAPVFYPAIPEKTARNSLSFPPISSNSHLPQPKIPSLLSLTTSRQSIQSPKADATTAVQVEKETTAGKSSPTLPFRVGHGFDLHRLEPGYPLIIGGINIPHDRGCEAHSDGDVLLHCVVDAILGALGLPDIGQIFPDSDPKWRGAASSIFLKEAGCNNTRQV